MSGPSAPACEVEKNRGSISAKSPSARMRSTSTEPTMPRQPTSPTSFFVNADSLVALQSPHYNVPDEGVSNVSRTSTAAEFAAGRPSGSPGFDVGKATDAYIATIPAADRAKSDAYFEGGYWIGAWGVLITVAICWILLRDALLGRLARFCRAARAPPVFPGPRLRRRDGRRARAPDVAVDAVHGLFPRAPVRHVEPGSTLLSSATRRSRSCSSRWSAHSRSPASTGSCGACAGAGSTGRPASPRSSCCSSS